MSVACFLIPYQPDKWKTISTDFAIEPSELEAALLDNWPSVSINRPPEDSGYLLHWRLNHRGGRSRTMGLQSDQQVVSLGIDTYLYEFINWYRSFISNDYRLYFCCASYHESDYLEITSQTSEDDLELYFTRKR